LGQIHYAVADGLTLAEIHVALKAEVWGVNDIPILCLLGQYQTDIIRGKKKVFDIAIGAAE
jgi:hypothetical protein